MSDDETIRYVPNPGARSATPPAQPSFAPVRHAYPLVVRDHGLGTAFGLLMRSLPYAVARFGILLAYTVACIVWLVITIGGAAWLGSHIASAFGFVWFIFCVVGIGWFWGAVLRYLLHLLACGHVAVLTDLITRGQVGNGSESQLAYGKRVVTERFGQVNALFGLNMLVRGILQAFHRTLDWIAEMLPIPGLETWSPGYPRTSCCARRRGTSTKSSCRTILRATIRIHGAARARALSTTARMPSRS